MKKIPTVFAVCVCLVCFLALTSSCKRDNVQTNSLSPTSTLSNPEQEAMKQLIAGKLNLSNLDDVSFTQVQQLNQKMQVFIFQKVDNTCRARLWQEKIGSIIAVTTNPARSSALEELRQLFTPSLYEHEAGNRNPDLSLAQWADRNKTLFSREEISVILIGLNRVAVDASTKRFNEIPGVANLFDGNPCPPYCPSEPSCLCNRTHYSLGCGTCQNAECTEQWGCGYGGNESCNGRCSGGGSSGGGGGGGGGGGW